LPGPAMFDWRELQRWHIRENLLPAGSIVQFREPTPWQRYKWVVLGSVLVFFAETLLISSLLVNLIRRRRAEHSLRESREALSDMSGRLIEAQEKERSWIALILHDDINQRLAALRLQLSLFGNRLPSSLDARQEELTAANRQIGELISDIQAMSHRLYSPSLKHVGLVQTAEALCREFSAAKHIDIQFHSNKILKNVPEEIRLCLFRVLQEALQNMAKHSGARRGQVILIGSPDKIELTVRDEGTGFHAKKAMLSGGLGLPSMEQRLKSVNGQVSIDSEPGRGTVIQVRVPLHFKQKAAHSG
jgi:signal transduction histidine kinase